MNTIQDFAANALLADVSYANGLRAQMTDRTLKDVLAGARFNNASSLANNVGNRYVVLNQYTDEAHGSGFSATVFQNKATGEVHFVCRGTDPSFADIVIADGGLAINGAASRQIVELVNYVKRLEAGVGTKNAAQYGFVAVPTDGTEAGGLSYAFKQVGTADGVDLLNAAGVKVPFTQVTVVGHSLGGHMATYFARLFPEHTDHLYTYNSAGFHWNSEGKFREFEDGLGKPHGTFPDANRQTNLFSENGLNVTTSDIIFSQLGQRISVFNEERTPLPDPFTNHYIDAPADTLALYDIFARLDPGLDIGQIDAMLRGASNQMNNTLEKTLQALSKLVLNYDATIAVDNRNAFYDALISLRDYVGNASYSLTPGDVVAPLVGMSASSLAGLAALDTPTGMAYRYTLQELNPFAIVNSANLYDQHNANGELDLYDPQTGNGDLTEQCLIDRAKLLNEINKANLADNSPASGVIQIAGDVLYQDKHSGYKIVGNDLFVSEHKKVLFGDDQADSFSGGGKADHLYGGAGDDTLHGGSGDDYLEGGTGKDELFGDDGSDALYGMAGNDKLDGGAGIDVLHGGTGNDILKGGDDLDILYGGDDDDTLDGGLGNDRLYGGNGNDTYQYKTGEGHDTITDIDGLGSTTFDGMTLNGGKKIGDGVYQSDDKQFTYLVVGDPSIGATIEVNGALTIENFKTGNLEITLGEPADTPPPPASSSPTPTFTDSDDLWGVIRDFRNPYLGSWTNPSGVWNNAYGLGGNDIMKGADGLGYLDGGTGNDYIFLGNGNKKGYGGDGNDIVTAVQQMTIYANTAGVQDWWDIHFNGWDPDFASNRRLTGYITGKPEVDTLGFMVEPFHPDHTQVHFGAVAPQLIDPNDPLRTVLTFGATFSQVLDSGSGVGEMEIHGGAGNDGLFGGNQNDVVFGEADDDGIAGNGGDDILLGGDGNDTILGGYGNDLIDGGADKDIVYGEYGDDIISGGSGDDALHGDSEVSHTKWALHGNDTIDGGAGNDSLFGEGGDDILRGGDGNDVLRGDGDLVPVAYQGNDYLDGGAGNDALQGFGGDDRIYGGTGDDGLIGNEGDDYLEGNEGNDQLYGGDGNDQLFGGAGDDTLTGDAGADTLDGGDGKDTLDGGDGNDILIGGNDIDQLQGGDGNDTLEGGAGDDSLLGQGGDDTIEGGAGDDGMVGGDGNDHLSGGTGDDALRGDAGNDVLDGGSGSNYLDGGDGNDTLISSGSNDTLAGGAGDDTYVIGSGNVLIDDTAGSNTLVMTNVANAAGLTLASIQNGDAVTLGLLGGGGVVFGADTGSIDTIRFADGSSIAYSSLAELQDHILTGNDNDGYVKGGKNTNDTIRGKKGRDLLIGGSGKDTFLFDVGDGKDVLSEDADGNVTLKFGPGVSAIQIHSQNACALAEDFVLSYGNQGDSILVKRGRKGVINKVEFADGTVMTAGQIAKQFNLPNADLKTTNSNDLLHGTVEVDIVRAGGGNDVLFGAAGDDLLDGEDGNDTLNGGSGNDDLRGGEGDDYLAGGAGNDTIVGDFGADTMFFARGDGQDNIGWDNGNSQDTLQFGPGITLNDLEFHRLANQDLEVVLRNTDDKITLQSWYSGNVDAKLNSVRFDDGSTFSLTSLPPLPVTPVAGTDGNDTMIGTRWIDDVFAGGAGDDVLQGKQGNDTLDGGAGNDTLMGEQGNDQLTGGNGTDRYELSYNMGTDTVVEVAGETSKLVLTDNIVASDLYFESRGKDLFVGTRGVAERAINGVVIKNYAEQNHTWLVEDSDGTQSDLSVLRSEHDASISVLVGSTTDSLIDHARSEFLNRAKNDIYTNWRGDQGRDFRPNIFESRLADNHVFSFQRSRHGFYTYDQQGFLSGNEGQSESVAFNFFGAPNDDFYNAYTRQVALIQNTSDDADIHRGSDDVSVISQSTTQIGIDFQGTTGTSTHNEYLDQANPVPNATRDKAFVREETVNGSTVISGHITGVVEQPTSDYVTLTQAAQAMFDTGTLPAKFLLTRNYIDTTTNIEDLKAGASDNNIDINGYAMIDGGAGDDIVNQFGTSDRSFIDQDDPVNSPQFALGQFIYGNDGNDKLWGRQYSDVLIGGNGNDFLNGAGGTDTYYVLPDATGIDVIYDSGTPFSYDGWEEVYANWFYQNQGYPNWRELRYSGTLPELPELSVNDYQKLDPWVRAGVIGHDTVEFAPGLTLADLHFAWGQADVTSTDGSVTAMHSLDITWGPNKGIQVVIPTEGVGTGIELFKFADGSLYTMADILHYAPPAPPGYLASHDDTGNDNAEPFVANPIAMQTTQEAELFVFTIPADAFADPNASDILTYTISLPNGDPLPSWLSFDPATRTLSGTPDDPQVGTISILVSATDQGGLSATTTFDLTVNNVNDAPIVAQALADQTATQDQAFSFIVPSTSFTDVDAGDTLSLSATLANGDPIPTWLKFNAATRTFSGTPANANVGNLTVKVTATDLAGAAVGSTFALAIANVNDAPIVVAPLAAQTTNEDQAFSFVLPASTFSDPDVGDSLTYSIQLANGNPLPSWLTFDAKTLTLSGQADDANVGTLGLTVTATDQGGLSASTSFNWVINNINEAPIVVVPMADQAAVDGSAFSYVIPAGMFTDPDAGDTLNFKVIQANGQPLPSWLRFDATTRTLSGTPGGTDLGNLALAVQVTDSGGLGASNPFNLNVARAADQVLTATSGNDTLVGLSGNDTLDGGIGADTLRGGLGNDTYIVDNIGDVVVESANQGIDTVRSSVTYTLATNVENLTLTGTANITGYGNASDNVLSGVENSGANILKGGAGNDTYLIGAGDKVYENANEGIDTVISDHSYTLTADTENLTLSGTTSIDGTGNAANNVLIGNSAANTLNGDAGADSMTGGAGDDIYVVDNAGDQIIEQANEGIDTVKNSISYTLGNNVENLTLTGTAAINGFGNALDNVMTGNSAANYLAGFDGNDTLKDNAANDILQGGQGNDTLTDSGGQNLLDGGAGNDTLTGNSGNELFIGGAGDDVITTGSGADMIAFNRGAGHDTVTASIGADNTLSLGGGIQYGDLSFHKTGKDLVLDTGAGESVTFQNWYAQSNYHSVVNLQMVEDAAADFNAAGGDPLHNNKIETFNFAGLVSKFDQAKAATPALTSWSLTNALLDFHTADSDTAALGGELAYQYGKNGNLANLSLTPAQGALGSNQFGATPQALQPLAGLQDSSVRLS